MNDVRSIRDYISGATLRTPQGQTEALAALRSLEEQLQTARDDGYDEGQAAIWDANVCSVCGIDHDREESAMCETGEVVTFREWFDAVGGRLEQLETYERALVEIGQPFSGVDPNLQHIARDALKAANPPARLADLFSPSNPASRQDA